MPSFSFLSDWVETEAWLKTMEVRVERGMAGALKGCAQVATDTARRQAPVLTGALRDSIKPSSRVEGAGALYTIKIAARGRPHLYVGQEEENTGFMDAACRQAEASMVAITLASLGRIWVD